MGKSQVRGEGAKVGRYVRPSQRDILKRLREFKRIGRPEFLKQYANGFGAITRFVLFEDELYDAKAVWAAAHNPPRRSGGFNTSEPLLYLPLLGFEVVSKHQAKVYAEGKRRYREASFFARNPSLVAEAKRVHGLKCMACRFDFGKRYGALGEGYIECHHLKQMADDEIRQSSVNDIAVLCANCHRMIHHGPKLLTIEQLRHVLRRPVA
jgi:hypothetical protein